MVSSGDLIFIKNVLSVDVDALRGVNYYTIKAMYNKIGEDGYASIVFKTVDKFDYTWSEIERDGGVGRVNSDLAECYGV